MAERTEHYRILYPRRRILRFFMSALGRFLMSILTRPTIIGYENLPKGGPLIVVGNHVAIVEAMMLAIYVPWTIEIIGNGDIPMDPRYAWLTKLWGFIPVRRGSVDRDEMRLPLDVLKQNGIIGLFPEGGIWETKMKKARTGVAWLSYHANAPVIPIGFGGMQGALRAALRFQRPKVVMNIGKVMPPVSGKVEGMSRKEALEYGANNIMAHVEALIPEEEKRSWKQIQDERFDFKFIVHDVMGDKEIPVLHPQGLGKFFHRPVILDVMARNMSLPVQPLQQLGVEHNAARLAEAVEVALKFLDDNPHFLSYRFGYKEAADMYAGVAELRDLARQAAAQRQAISLQPIRHYRRDGDTQEITETLPGMMHEM